MFSFIYCWLSFDQTLKKIGFDWKGKNRLEMQQNVKGLEQGHKKCENRKMSQIGLLHVAVIIQLVWWMDKEELKEQGNFKIGDGLINTVKYADDLVMLTADEPQRQNMISR